MKISKNKNFREEYCASIVKIGEILPIEGKDRIAKTMVNGLSIVIGKTEYNTGDVAVYVSNECVIHELFLHLNNMYDDKELNANKEERGYINNKGRVRLIRLGGVPSFGILLNPKSIALFLNESVESVTKFLESHVGEDFELLFTIDKENDLDMDFKVIGEVNNSDKIEITLIDGEIMEIENRGYNHYVS